LCGRGLSIDLGPELFLQGTWYFVCWECGEKVDPWLVAALRLYRAVDAKDPDYGNEELSPVFERAVQLLKEADLSE